MIISNITDIAIVMLILLMAAAGLLMYALCVVSKNADELAENMYIRMTRRNNGMDNHSHLEK